MDIIPAIDLIDGKCVRLVQGDFAQKTVYGDNPLEVALHFQNLGLKRLHVVDLDGAKKGEVQQLKVLEQLASKTNLEIDFSGGIKSLDAAQAVLDAGASYFAVGSMAVKNPELLEEILSHIHPKKILLAADVKDGFVATAGWQQQSGQEIISFLRNWVKQGITQAFVTDISKDGMLQGPSFELYTEILDQVPELSLIASGGVSKMQDLEQLKQQGLSGAIVGKAYYEKRISDEELIKYNTSHA